MRLKEKELMEILLIIKIVWIIFSVLGLLYSSKVFINAWTDRAVIETTPDISNAILYQANLNINLARILLMKNGINGLIGIISFVNEGGNPVFSVIVVGGLILVVVLIAYTTFMIDRGRFRLRELVRDRAEHSHES